MNTTFSKNLILGFTFTALVLPMAAIAQSGPPPGLPVADIAAALGVSEAALKSCMPEPTQGVRPERPDVAAITFCLRTENPEITQDFVGQTLENFAPAQARPSN